MSGALEKFGIYDFMGIWAPGAITITYYLATLYYRIADILRWLEIDFPSVSEKYRLIIMYSVIAYIIGVILHEIGKLLADRLTVFDTAKITDCAFKKVEAKGFGWKIRVEYKTIIERTFNSETEYTAHTFEQAHSMLKYDPAINTRRIDTYHSVYGMSRSLSLCFVLHGIIEFCIFMIDLTTTRHVFFIIFIDIILAYFFLERAYRYYCSWVRNVFVHYYKKTKIARKV